MGADAVGGAGEREADAAHDASGGVAAAGGRGAEGADGCGGSAAMPHGGGRV
jgi:hypothetical protein